MNMERASQTLAGFSSEHQRLVGQLLVEAAHADGTLSHEERQLLDQVIGVPSHMEESSGMQRARVLELLQDVDKARVIFDLVDQVLGIGGRHEEERSFFLDLVQQVQARTHLVPMDELKHQPGVLFEMIQKTPRICHQKGSWWQKSSRNPRRVAASISWDEGSENQKYFTGVNTELSTPTGSRCAEQNALGAIASQHRRLRFESFRDMVVYGGGGLKNPLLPCGVCMEQLSKINERSQRMMVYCYPPGWAWKPGGQLPSSMLRVELVRLELRRFR